MTDITDMTPEAKAEAKATALFKKEERARDGQEAMATYQADGIAIRLRTARLRALRLARPSDVATKPKPVERAKPRKRYD